MNGLAQTAQDFFRGNMSEARRQQTFVIIFMLILVALLPPDNAQLLIGIFGAFMYIVLRPVDPVVKNKTNQRTDYAPNRHDQRAGLASPYRRDHRASFAVYQRPMPYPKQRIGRPPQVGAQVSYKPEVKRVSRHPVTTFAFESNSFDEQVEELLTQMEPDARSQEAVGDIVGAVRRHVRQILPDAKVSGFCHARVTRATAFGVAVPEVDVVVTCSRQELAEHAQERSWKDMDSTMCMNVRGLQKAATRAIAERLVCAGGFKFRRSGFKCDEPKVTIMAPRFGLGDPVPVDLSVNGKVPLCNAAILELCTAIEPRARSLVMLVKRWAKDRGICHAAKGHLPPYAWTLLVVYFLQVGVEDEPLLPSLQNYNLLSRVHALAEAATETCTVDAPCSFTRGALELSVGELFTAFLHFFASINWNEEIASVRLGRKAVNTSDLRMCALGKKKPRIEDPFECGRNLADIMNELSIERLHEEIARAKQMLSDGAGLKEITQPWEPA